MDPQCLVSGQSHPGGLGAGGSVYSPPCRWPVRRPCRPCTMSCSGPSSVHEVPPHGLAGVQCCIVNRAMAPAISLALAFRAGAGGSVVELPAEMGTQG